MLPPNNTESITSLNSQNIVSLEAERLLRQLVEEVNAAVYSEELQGARPIEDHVMFESCIDGLQYRLIRFCPQENRQINLSPREIAIARLVAQGLPNKCIGNTLNISSHTVSTHLRRIFFKLGVTSRAAMVARLMEEFNGLFCRERSPKSEVEQVKLYRSMTGLGSQLV